MELKKYKIMNLTIDTMTKTIILNQEVMISDLILELKKLNIDINEYKLIIQPVVYTYPSIYPYYNLDTIQCNPSYSSGVSK